MTNKDQIIMACKILPTKSSYIIINYFLYKELWIDTICRVLYAYNCRVYFSIELDYGSIDIVIPNHQTLKPQIIHTTFDKWLKYSAFI